MKEHIGEWVAIDQLKKWDKNPRDNTQAIDKVADSIKRFGFAAPIIARKEDQTIIAGHTRFAAAQKLGLDKVPVRFMDLDPADAKLLALADNKLGELAEWDQPLLKTIFETESFELDDLNIAGFDFAAMDDLLGDDFEPEIKDHEQMPEASEHDIIPLKVEPTTKAGDDIQIGRHRMICGECVEVMKTLEENSIDCVICDPPYGIDFMSKAWDRSTPNNEWAAECFRILKPGGHLIAFAATRTFHRLGMVVEQAGFEIRDTINWLYFSGFPKSHSVSKGIDSHFGAEREVIGKREKRESFGQDFVGGRNYEQTNINITAPSTPEAKQFDGYGSALKPAFEPAILARKPLSEKNIAENVLKWGTGGLNIDGSRFGYGDPCWVGPNENVGTVVFYNSSNFQPNSNIGTHSKGLNVTHQSNNLGRWPANIFQCPKASRSEREEGCEELPTKTGFEAVNRKEGSAGVNNPRAGAGRTAAEVKNIHPTVKPIKLMRWLCRLVMPPTEDAVVLDTFAGSGSTLVAAELEGFASIGIEMNPEYCDIIASRVNNAVDNDG